MKVSNVQSNQYISYKGTSQRPSDTNPADSSTALQEKKKGMFPTAKAYLGQILQIKSGGYYNCVNQPVVDKINQLEEDYKKLTDEELAHKTVEFKEILSKRKTSADPMEDMELEEEVLDEILPDAYATIREVSRRVLNKRHHPEQLLGGISLHNGQIIEMRTGEGKTLVETLPVYLNALTGKGVHVVTVNDYLAQRDCEEMSKLYNALGLSVGCISSNNENYIFEGEKDSSGKTKSMKKTADSRKEPYQCDITYGTNSEFGFDYLRDNMAKSPEGQVQRPYNFAIIDEVDSILIDDARTPLIISGQQNSTVNLYTKMADVANKLKKDIDYEVIEEEKNVILTEQGMSKAEELLGISDLYDLSTEYAHRLNQALKAKEVFQKDKDYVIQDGEIVIVGESTGRAMKGRAWGDGLHQAIEAKEGVQIHEESRTLASVTYQNLFRLYPKLAGMTGTAMTEKEEFRKIYGLEVNKIPTHLADKRIDYPDAIFKTEQEKMAAIVEEIERIHKTGRPVLIGTTDIEKSEQLSERLKAHGIEHNVLNAKQYKKEASIIAQAGRYGAVTIATNMAGRGTDILLGGNPEFLAIEELKDKGITPENTPDYEEIKDALKFEKKKITDLEHKKVAELGGLHVIGTEKHDSVRIDNQLRGRAARQGDPGSTKFFVSLEDNLVRLYGSEEAKRQAERLKTDESTPADSKTLKTLVDRCQKSIEGAHFASRKNLLEYDNVLSLQRKKFYEERAKILQEPDLRKYIVKMIEKETDRIIAAYISPDVKPDEIDEGTLYALIDRLRGEIPQLSSLSADELKGMKYEDIQAKIKKLATEAYKQREAEIVETYSAFAEQQGANRPAGEAFTQESIMRKVEKELLLKIADESWMDHLTYIDALRNGIGLRAYSGKDPLEEYKLEAFEMYEDTMEDIQSEMVKTLFKLKFNTKKYSTRRR